MFSTPAYSLNVIYDGSGSILIEESFLSGREVGLSSPVFWANISICFLCLSYCALSVFILSFLYRTGVLWADFSVNSFPLGVVSFWFYLKYANAPDFCLFPSAIGFSNLLPSYPDFVWRGLGLEWVEVWEGGVVSSGLFARKYGFILPDGFLMVSPLRTRGLCFIELSPLFVSINFLYLLIAEAIPPPRDVSGFFSWFGLKLPGAPVIDYE